jgi:hypothetical protein
VKFKVGDISKLTTHFLLAGREIIVGGVADLTVRWSYGPDGV